MDEFIIEQVNLTIKRGDTTTYILYLEDEDGKNKDITGWTIFFTVKSNIDDADDDAVIKKTITTHTNPTNGETQIFITSTDSANVGNYVYDIQYKDTVGNIKTIMEGYFAITKDVTQRES